MRGRKNNDEQQPLLDRSAKSSTSKLLPQFNAQLVIPHGFNGFYTSIKDIMKKGKMIGQGAFGAVYKVNHQINNQTITIAYKVYYAETADVNSVETVRGRWDDTYNRLYNGKYKKFACAKVIQLDGCPILVTPFIEGNSLKPTEDWARVRADLKSASIVMGDRLNEGNIKVNTAGHYLPIDFDCVAKQPPEWVEKLGNNFSLICCFSLYLCCISAPQDEKDVWRNDAYCKYLQSSPANINRVIENHKQRTTHILPAHNR